MSGEKHQYVFTIFLSATNGVAYHGILWFTSVHFKNFPQKNFSRIRSHIDGKDGKAY